MGNLLVRYEAARTALAAAHRIDEVKDIRDKAQAMAAYAKQARDTAMIQWATEIKVRAERRCGEMLRDTAANGERAGQGRPDKTSRDATFNTLKDIGITRDQSSRYQKLAAMPDEHFEAAVEVAKETAGEVTSAHMLRVAEELRANRDLSDQLDEARRRLDRNSRATESWRPILIAAKLLRVEIDRARRLPAIPKNTRAELTELWGVISPFLSTLLEHQRHAEASDH